GTNFEVSEPIAGSVVGQVRQCHHLVTLQQVIVNRVGGSEKSERLLCLRIEKGWSSARMKCQDAIGSRIIHEAVGASIEKGHILRRSQRFWPCQRLHLLGETESDGENANRCDKTRYFRVLALLHL